MSYSNTRRGRSFGSPRRFQQSQSRRTSIAASRYVSAAIEPSQEDAHQARHAFPDFGLNDTLVANVLAHGYTSPTPIQDQAIPLLLEGRDVVGIANTGTGKTAAFLLPLINKVVADLDQGVLILAPTRELALQILEEFKAFAAGLPIGVSLCIGGMNIHTQIQELKKSPHFVIGTPGRIKDLINRRVFKTELFTNIVLDEVDRMLDIGFRKDIMFLISQLPEKRHAAFFSATMNRDTEEIMRTLLTNPVTVSVKKRETVSHIEQAVVTIQNGKSKIDVLYEFLQQEEFEKVIVFGRTKHGINKLEKQLFARGIRVSAIHGNKSQNARQRSLQQLKQGKVKALLATDVAARGIDIEGVTHVINFDEPMTYEDYIHRIGRTGRAGKMGKAITFVQR
jgi:ATP-dependent RNA helicase RhlE